MNKTIGIIYKDEAGRGLQHDYFAAILEGFRQECHKNYYNISLMNSIEAAENPDTYIQQVRNFGYEAVLVACSESSPAIDALFQNNILTAAIDMDYQNAISIKSDNKNGMKDLTEYLISMGHRRMAIILGDDNLVSSIRLNEFSEACRKNKISIPEEYILRSSFCDINTAGYLTDQLLKLHNPPSCILYPDDYAAIGGINVIHARGLTIPDDISITGYDGNHVLSELEPTLTTVSQNALEIGKIAAQQLLYHLANPEDKDYKEYVVDAVLKSGCSVGKVYDNLR